jgi:hypothetical protein
MTSGGSEPLPLGLPDLGCRRRQRAVGVARSSGALVRRRPRAAPRAAPPAVPVVQKTIMPTRNSGRSTSRTAPRAGAPSPARADAATVRASSAPAAVSRYRCRAGRLRGGSASQESPPARAREADEDRVDRAGPQAEGAAQVVAVASARACLGEGGEHGRGLRGGTSCACHNSNIYLDRESASDKGK